MYIFIILILCIFWLFLKSERPANFPPGPKWWPFIGNLPIVYLKFSKLKFHHLVWNDFVKAYGPIVGLKLGKVKLIVISNKDLIKEVSIRDEFEGRPDGYLWRLRSKGNRFGIAFADGPSWAELRKFSMLHLKKLGYGSTLMEDFINEEITDFIDWLHTSENSPINISRIFTFPIINTIWAMIAGKRYEQTNDKLREVCKAMEECFRILDGSGGTLQQFPILRHIAPAASGYNALMKNHDIMWNFLFETIEYHKQTIKMGITRDFIDAFLHEMKNNEKSATFTENQLLITCLDFLQAGSDTTSNTLEFVILFLIRNQDVQKKIEKEIDEIIGNHRKPRYEDRFRMPYTLSVLMEVQRMAFVAPMGVPHRACIDTTLAGYEIPKDSTIILHMWNMHKDIVWEDPDKFRPERFIDKEGNIINNENFAPFGFGKRRCIGENLTKTNMFLFVTNIIQNFQILPVNINDIYGDVKIMNGLTIAPKPFQVIFKPKIQNK